MNDSCLAGGSQHSGSTSDSWHPRVLGYNRKYKPPELKRLAMNGAHCFPEGRYQCKDCLPRAWLQRAAEPREPSWPSWAQQCPGLSTVLQAPLGAPSPNPPLPLARRTSGLGILESVLEYQQEILLALLSLNLCLLDSGQCPKGVCCPGCVSCRKRECSPFPPTSVCVSAFEPVGNAFYSVPRHSAGFQQP